MMDREREHDELIELGAASVETKGLQEGRDDFQGGLVQPAGISND